MKRIRNSISNFSVRNVSGFNRSSRKLFRKADYGLLPDGITAQLDLMTFYVERNADHAAPPEDILRLFEQLSNVEEKVKAMEGRLDRVHHRNLNVLPVHEDREERRGSEIHRRKMNRKRKKGARCLCFPWGCRPEASESHMKKKPGKGDGKPKSDRRTGEANGLQHTSRGSKVSWDEDITVRYIGSNDDVTRKVTKRKREPVNKGNEEEDSHYASPDEDDVKDVVHVKIRIPKNQKDSANNIIEITGQNIEATEYGEVDDLKVATVFRATGSGKTPSVAITDEHTGETKSTVTTTKSSKLQSKCQVKTKPRFEKNNKKDKHSCKNSSDDGSETDNVEENCCTPKLLVTSESSKKFEPKKCTAEIISETNKTPEIRQCLHSKKNFDRQISSADRTTDAKVAHERISSSLNNRDKSHVEELIDERPDGFENEGVEVDPITFIERPDRLSERSIGIPLKEPGRMTCGSLGCKCKGSNKNDGNLYELKKSLDFNESDISLLDNMMEKPDDPEDTAINTDLGIVNVVTHRSHCNCKICQTFGSHGGTRRNSIRSDTGAIVSKRVVRVKYDDGFRNVVTHTEECGCAICVRIDEHMYKNRFRRSTQISTRDSILLVENKGVCGCTDCKTVTVNKQNTDDDRSNDFSGIANYMETFASSTSYRSVNPCFYSDATVPSINSFPLQRFIAYQNEEEAGPSIDGLSSSEEVVPTMNHYKQIIVDPKMRRTPLKRIPQETNKSNLVISTKNWSGHGESGESSSDNLQPTPHKRWRHQKNKTGNDKKEESQNETYDTNHDPLQEPVKRQQLKRKRNKVREVEVYNKDCMKPDDVSDLKKHDDTRGKKSHQNSKRARGKAERWKKHRRICKNENYDRDDPQMTLEEIIKDLINGQSDVSGDKTYTVTLGKIHDKPYTKVKIIDCSKPEIENSSSMSSSESQISPSHNQNSSNSAVYFLKSIPSISVSPTRSSNFARSEETSVLTDSHSILRDDKGRVFTPLPHLSRQSISQRPSLFVLSPIKEYKLENQVNEPVEEDGVTITPATNNIENRPPATQNAPPTKLRQRVKTNKFTVKLSGKVCSFFKRNSKKIKSPAVTSAGSPMV